MAKLPPTPVGVPPGHSYWNDWYEKLRDFIDNAVQFFSDLDFTGSNITSIATRNHNDLQSFQGGASNDYYHLTSAQHTALNAGFTGTGNLVRATTPTLVTPVIGAATGTSLALSAGITTGSSTLHTTSVALTNGAGTSSGTITNAPSVGNPTKWVPINDNGTTRYIPTWT